MRAIIIIAVLACCFSAINTQGTGIPNPNLQLSIWRFTGYNTDNFNLNNWQCMSRDNNGNIACTGPYPQNYTDETLDQIRTWYCGINYENITVQVNQNIVWPGFYVYQGSGYYSESCFKLAVEGSASLSIYSGGLYFFSTTDFKASACYSTDTATFEIRALNTPPFNPKSFETITCPGTVIMKTYTGIEAQRINLWSRRIAFRNMRGNITLSQNNGQINYWTDQYPLSFMELGSWSGYEPIFNIYGNFIKRGDYSTRTVLQTTTSTIKMTWHSSSYVDIQSPWMINDLKPVSGPNTINGYVCLNNSNLQIEGNWQINGSATVEGNPNGYGNLTYLTATSGNTLTLAGTFNNMFFFGNTSGVTYLTTGTFNNVSAILTDRAIGWTWNRQFVPGTATFSSIQLGVSNSTFVLTLRNGNFSFDKQTGPGSFNLINATVTVAGITRSSP